MSEYNLEHTTLTSLFNDIAREIQAKTGSNEEP